MAQGRRFPSLLWHVAPIAPAPCSGWSQAIPLNAAPKLGGPSRCPHCAASAHLAGQTPDEPQPFVFGPLEPDLAFRRCWCWLVDASVGTHLRGALLALTTLLCPCGPGASASPGAHPCHPYHGTAGVRGTRSLSASSATQEEGRIHIDHSSRHVFRRKGRITLLPQCRHGGTRLLQFDLHYRCAR